MRKGFNLIELILVVGIIGILMSVLLGLFSGSSDSAKAVQCLNNMKELAGAVTLFGGANGQYPAAGSSEAAIANDLTHYECRGWLSWNSRGASWGRSNGSQQCKPDWFTSAYSDDEEAIEWAYKNGALFPYVSGNRRVFICPQHQKLKPKVGWSYVMNEIFFWDREYQGDGFTIIRQGPEDISPTHGFCDTRSGGHSGTKSFEGQIEYGALGRSERTLLFAEMPFAGIEGPSNFSPSPGFENDCILQCSEPFEECIGFNHRVGKVIYANVVFADGHVERISWPSKWKIGSGDRENLKELTKLLCSRAGKDVTFNGSKFEELR